MFFPQIQLINKLIKKKNEKFTEGVELDEDALGAMGMGGILTTRANSSGGGASTTSTASNPSTTSTITETTITFNNGNSSTILIIILIIIVIIVIVSILIFRFSYNGKDYERNIIGNIGRIILLLWFPTEFIAYHIGTTYGLLWLLNGNQVKAEGWFKPSLENAMNKNLLTIRNPNIINN